MKLLHIMNGDSAADRLGEAGVEGEILVYPELYHEGPLPAGLEGEAWIDIRARHFAAQGWADYGQFVDRFRQLEQRLQAFREFGEAVLWFEHDLYDQLLLIRHLDWFSRRELGNTRLSLICIDRFPGHKRFYGLGQLSPSQRASLLAERQPVTAPQMDLGRRAWQAFRSDDPTRLERLSLDGNGCLPFLPAALKRHLEEFPSTRNGLSRNQRQILQACRKGSQTPAQLFSATFEMEQSPYLGDTTFFSYLDGLFRTAHPLLAKADGTRFLPRARSAGREFLEQQLALTPEGERILQGQEDAVELNGIDRWLGGVHLQGRDPLWRWDVQQRRLRARG